MYTEKHLVALHHEVIIICLHTSFLKEIHWVSEMQIRQDLLTQRESKQSCSWLVGKNVIFIVTVKNYERKTGRKKLESN